MPDDSVPPLTPPPPPIPPAPQPPTENQEQTWNMWCHMSALAGLVVPFGNLLGPFLVWQTKKNEIPSVVVHGKAALNFQLTVLIAVVACIVAGFILSFFCIGVVFFPLAGVLYVCSLVFAIIAGVKANDGKPYEYPWSLKLIN